MHRYPRLEVRIILYPFEEEFLQNLGYYGQDTDWSIFCDISGVFPGFGSMMIFAYFSGAGQYYNLVIGLNMCRRVCRPSGGIS